MWACDGYLPDVNPSLVSIPNPPTPSIGAQSYPYLMNELGQAVLNEKGQKIYFIPAAPPTIFVMGTDSNTAILAGENLIGVNNNDQ